MASLSMTGVLRVDFPGSAGSDRLEEIEREARFRTCVEERLAFVYRGHEADGSDSTFFTLVQR